ncbi:MAG: hypothetical protein M1839_009144 [Geoglossum umbratile]|nr:MAG: hypothetical protein M1839_009144 [Geoglossum umbratile]
MDYGNSGGRSCYTCGEAGHQAVIAPSRQRRRHAIAARNQDTSPVTAPIRIPVLGVSVTAPEPALNVTNAERKAISLAIALLAVLVADTADTVAAKDTVVVAATVEGVLPIRTATHAEGLATWPEIVLRVRGRSVTTVENLGI